MQIQIDDGSGNTVPAILTEIDGVYGVDNDFYFLSDELFWCPNTLGRWENDVF